MLRDLMKTISFALLHFGVGFGVTYALTGSVAIATGVALIEPTVNTVVFFFHERIWARFPAKVALHGGHGYRHGIDQPDVPQSEEEPDGFHVCGLKPHPLRWR